SSAGPAAATAAALVGFAIGTETWGSIVSPSTRCGVTGLRPTFGRVSRHGAMALSWSMDKAGPICRSTEGAGLVFAAVHGADGRDPDCRDLPFAWPRPGGINGLRVGVVTHAFGPEKDNPTDHATLKVLRSLGIEPVEIELPDLPIDPLALILNAEAAAAFDELTRSNRDEELVRQVRNAWPNVFRHARLIPAVEYIQANRVRTLLMQRMVKLFRRVDLYICPTFGNDNLLLTNLTGHPALVLPNGFDEKGHPLSITITADLFAEAKLLALGQAIQQVTDHHGRRPPGFSEAPKQEAQQ
ncbi:MAG: amidase, partial [Candidatus Aminicenantes bacterium]|nr:amidase [Candidatus Aminicenantes bacterium]